MTDVSANNLDPSNAVWRIRDRVLHLADRPLVLGIVNVTPDSFSDGGRYLRAEAAVEHGLNLVAQGADLLDVGGESTRPGAMPLAPEEELARIAPVVEGLVQRTTVPLSVDTYHAETANACLRLGAHIINDVTGMRGDEQMTEVIATHQAGVIVMHMLGNPRTMQDSPCYNDVVSEIGAFFQERLHHLQQAGIGLEQIVFDPGIGFGKTVAHNCRLLADARRFLALGRPLCWGISRKGFIGHILGGRPVHERLAGSLAAVAFMALRNAAHVLRVHDVQATRDVLSMIRCLQGL